MWSFLGSRQGFTFSVCVFKAPHEILTHSAFWKILIQPKPLHLERENLRPRKRQRWAQVQKVHLWQLCQLQEADF